MLFLTISKRLHRPACNKQNRTTTARKQLKTKALLKSAGNLSPTWKNLEVRSPGLLRQCPSIIVLGSFQFGVPSVQSILASSVHGLVVQVSCYSVSHHVHIPGGNGGKEGRANSLLPGKFSWKVHTSHLVDSHWLEHWHMVAASSKSVCW